LRRQYLIDSRQLRLIYQFSYIDHETMIAHRKQIETSYETQFSINLVLKNKIKKNKKNNLSQLKLINLSNSLPES